MTLDRKALEAAHLVVACIHPDTMADNTNTQWMDVVTEAIEAYEAAKASEQQVTVKVTELPMIVSDDAARAYADGTFFAPAPKQPDMRYTQTVIRRAHPTMGTPVYDVTLTPVADQPDDSPELLALIERVKWLIDDGVRYQGSFSDMATHSKAQVDRARLADYLNGTRLNKREVSDEEEQVLFALFNAAEDVLGLMNEVPLDQRGQNDRVFAHYEFDELRRVLSICRSLKRSADNTRRG